jgi:RNA polymerase sigma factor (sigma-70 family)
MADFLATGATRDSELVRAALAGDAGSLGLLLARHRAGMYAVALAVLGHSQDAEDAVQEAALIALRRFSDVRDPDAVGPWLRMVVRNECRARLRKMSAVPMAEPTEAVAVGRREGPPDPAEVIEQHALRDWVWSALEGLSPGLRLVTMLRYFTDVTSYEDIAALCATPVGTVRSRLHQARTQLAGALLQSADLAHDDVTALNSLHRRLAEETMVSAHGGEFASALSDWWSPQARVTWPTGKHTGIDYLPAAFDHDLSDGVRHELLNVVASREVVIWEEALHNPPEDPFHCPPGVVWVHFLDRGRVSKLRLYHPRGRGKNQAPGRTFHDLTASCGYEHKEPQS